MIPESTRTEKGEKTFSPGSEQSIVGDLEGVRGDDVFIRWHVAWVY